MNLCAYWNTSFQGSTMMIIAPHTTIKMYWRATATSLAFQLLLETRYFQLLTWKCALCSLCASPLLLPTTMSASFCFSATARRLREGAVEASLGAHCRPRVLSVNWGTYRSASEELSKTNIKGAWCSLELRSCPQWKATSCCHWRMPGALELKEAGNCISMKVLDSTYGWTGFRSSFGNSTWTWLTAAFDPK